MKKLLLCWALVWGLTHAPVAGINAQFVPDKLTFKGKISPDNENEDNETDPPFKVVPVTPSIQKVKAGNAKEKPVSELENGLQIVKDIMDKMIASEYNFSLLSQHKYMINSCLGFKVSAGQFNVKFSNPAVEIGSLGKITIKLKINRINLSALKIRMRPCTKPEHLLDPCHFGKKFEIGGEATDISLKIVFAPVARALDGSAGLCFFALDDNILFNWDIWGLNLKPMQNNLDDLGKEMLEDGLNLGMFNVLYARFISISKEVIPKYFTECENAYDAKDKMEKISGGMTAGDEKDKTGSANETGQWVITPAINMKGVLGRLNTQFEKDVWWSLDVRTPEDKFIINHSASSPKTYYDLAPGNYIFRLNTVNVENVPIERGKETRLKTGVLNIVSEERWDLYNETKSKFQTSGNKPAKLALPVGRYQLRLGGQYFPVEIKDGITVEF